jgi:hypothetical protein
MRSGTVVSRDEFRRLLDDYMNAVADVTLRMERSRPEKDVHQALNAAANARMALETAVFGS